MDNKIGNYFINTGYLVYRYSDYSKETYTAETIRGSKLWAKHEDLVYLVVI